MSDDVPPLPRIKHPKRMLALSDDEIPTPIILKDDLDFQATYDYVLNLRREIRDYLCPGTWQEIELKPIPVHRYVRPRIAHSPFYNTVRSQINYNMSLIEKFRKKTKFAAASDIIDDKVDLPIFTVNMAKAVWFRWRVLSRQDYLRIRPPHIYDNDNPQLEKYIELLSETLDQMEYEILHRARQITSSIVLANVKSEEFKRRCRSEIGMISLAIFFFKTVTDEQLYYIYGPIWSAVDFSFIPGSDEKPPNGCSIVSKIKWDLRMFTKLGFGYLASHYFSNCLQRTGSRRIDSKQVPRAEIRAFSLSRKPSVDLTKMEVQSESTERADDNNAENEDLFAVSEALNHEENPFGEYPEVEIGEREPCIISDDEAREIERYAIGVGKTLHFWGRTPKSDLKHHGMLPAAFRSKRKGGLSGSLTS
ncbi:hypothetical protein MFRU_006g03240 [Monilinia fructicola]|nr:hypothetical protein MFRU_006g03240 [Monilinia fructicola]